MQKKHSVIEQKFNTLAYIQSNYDRERAIVGMCKNDCRYKTEQWKQKTRRPSPTRSPSILKYIDTTSLPLLEFGSIRSLLAPRFNYFQILPLFKYDWTDHVVPRKLPSALASDIHFWPFLMSWQSISERPSPLKSPTRSILSAWAHQPMGDHLWIDGFKIRRFQR